MISAVMTQTNIREGVKSTAFLQYIHTGSIYSIKYWYQGASQSKIEGGGGDKRKSSIYNSLVDLNV